MPKGKQRKVRPAKRKPARRVKAARKVAKRIAKKVAKRPLRKRVARRVAIIVRRAPVRRAVGRALRARRKVQSGRKPLIRVGREAVVAALPRIGRAMGEEEE
jgi:hypothetical protein